MIETKTVKVSRRKADKELRPYLSNGWRVVSQSQINTLPRMISYTLERENDDTSGMYPFRPPIVTAPEARGVTPQPVVGDIALELERLASLYERGLLTTEEFADAKQRALGQATVVSPISGDPPSTHSTEAGTHPTGPEPAEAPLPTSSRLEPVWLTWSASQRG